MAYAVESAVTETAREAPKQPRRRRWLPASELEFVGCESCRMTVAEYRALRDERIELYDFEATRVWRVAEGPYEPHERPLARFAAFVERVAMVRGAPIMLGRGAGLHLLDADRQQVRAMHPDEMVFLDPARQDRIGSQYVFGASQEHPDAVVEVDDTTDVRRNKLIVYADWGFPELWVEVPEVYSPSRPRSRRPGLTIYLLEEGEYRESERSRAFPGLSAEAAHRVLNERSLSAETEALASRVGRALGAREGTGPEDDPLLREQREEARADGIAEGIARGRAEGIAQGRAEANAVTARALLRSRGFVVSAAFPEDLPPADRIALREASPETLAAAAVSAASVNDFLRRLRESPGY